jgi:O-antigen/teichoic acid export membrane protein
MERSILNVRIPTGWRPLSWKRLFQSASLFATGMMMVAMVANFVTGVLSARALGDSGRGELAAVQTTTIFMTYLLACGLYQAVLYLRASGEVDASTIVGSLWLPAVLIGLVTVAAIQLVIPVLLKDQHPDLQLMARLFALSAGLAPISEVFTGVLMGEHRYHLMVALRSVPPLLLAAFFSLLWLTDTFSVPSALVATVCAALPVLLVSAFLVLRRHRLGPRKRGVFRSALSFGLRSHLTGLTGIINARLDLFLLPLIFTTASIGHYALATSLAAAAAQLPSALHPLVMPMAARDRAGSRATVSRLALGTAALGTLVVVPLLILAPWFVETFYGRSFSASVLPLRILAPSWIIAMIGGVYASGILGLGRPLLAAAGQLVALVVTVVGLALVFSAGWDITAIAIISGIAYCAIFLVNIVVFHRLAEGLEAPQVASLEVEGET